MSNESEEPDILMSAVREAVAKFTEMIGRQPDRVTGARREDDGWSVLVDVVELERVPASTEVLATYRVDLDQDRGPSVVRATSQVLPGDGRSVMTFETSLRPRQPDSLADLLERVVDKGVVVMGDIVVNVLDIELLTLKVRLFIASAQTAQEMGMDWWSTDPFFTGRRRDDELEAENEQLRRQVAELQASEPSSGGTADG